MKQMIQSIIDYLLISKHWTTVIINNDNFLEVLITS